MTVDVQKDAVYLTRSKIKPASININTDQKEYLKILVQNGLFISLSEIVRLVLIKFLLNPYQISNHHQPNYFGKKTTSISFFIRLKDTYLESLKKISSEYYTIANTNFSAFVRALLDDFIAESRQANLENFG